MQPPQPPAGTILQPAGAPVLIVDDNAGNLLALRAVLEPLGEQIVEFASGEAALKYLLNHDCAAIVLDAHLPGMTGFEVAEILRARPRTRDVPILFVTGTVRDGANAGYAQGAFDYIVKPFDPDALRAKVAALVKLYRQRRHAEAQRDALVESERLAKAQAASERATMYGLLAQAPAAIARLRGPTHIFDFANAVYIEAIGGRDPSGKTVRQALPELEGQPFFAVLDRVYASGEPYTANEVPARIARVPDGSLEEAFFNFVYQPTRDVHGRVDGILIHAVEVTEQVRARQSVEALSEKLRKSEAQFRLMAEAIPQQVWTARADGSIEFVNSKVLEYTGRSSEEVLAEGWTKPVHPEDLPGCVEAWKQAIESGQPFEVEFRLKRASDGSYRWHLGRALAARDESGAIVRWYGTVTDIHDRKEAADQLKGVAHFQQQLLAVVGHDLRNPLHSIWMTAKILLQKAELAAEPGLARIARSAARMNRMINDLLEFTRARLGRGFEVRRQTCSIADLCREVIDELAAVHPARAIRLQAEDAGEGAWDPSRLQQMISNLIANGLQYSPPESEVVVRIAGQDEEIVVEVANAGMPIPPKALETIFEPFKRLEGSQSEGAHLGLGLYIVQQVARAHGGSVEVRSSDRSGTRFLVHLPRGP